MLQDKLGDVDKSKGIKMITKMVRLSNFGNRGTGAIGNTPAPFIANIIQHMKIWVAESGSFTQYNVVMHKIRIIKFRHFWDKTVGELEWKW